MMDDMDDMDDTAICLECGGIALLLGVLGNTHHYRCVQCGLRQSEWEMNDEPKGDE